MYRDGFFCPLAKMVMGETAEVLAEQYKITREEQDEFALTSQTRAARAIAAGRFDAEIVPVTIETKKGITTFARDEHPFPPPTIPSLTPPSRNSRSCLPSSRKPEPSLRRIPLASPTARPPWSLPVNPS